MKIPEWVDKTLAAFDQEPKPHNVLTVMEALDRARRGGSDLSDEELKGFLADRTAFYFIEYRTRPCPWNTYLGPMGSGTLNDGEQVFWPDIKEIDAEIIAHWENRATATIGALDDDPDGRLHHQLGQTMNFHQPFLVRNLRQTSGTIFSFS